VKMLNKRQVLMLHRQLIEQTGGSGLEYSQEELSQTILRLAAGETGYENLLDWLLSHQAQG